MNIREFQEASKRTAPFNAKATNEQELNWFLSNYSLGLVGEVLELSQVLDQHKLVNEKNKDYLLDDFIKESGDVFHYLVNLLTVTGEEFKESNLTESEKGLKYLAGDFTEHIKKGIYHGHGLDKDEMKILLYKMINELMDYVGDYLENVLESNIDKLKKRYPDKFTTQASIDRVDTK